MSRLNINIDHVATIRQARGGVEPDPITAASLCELAGAEGIVCHLREDRRHASDRDVRMLKQIVQTKLDLEMAASEEIILIALEVVPHLVTIVPEHRLELTTEGGLDVKANVAKYLDLSKRMHEKGIEVSYFIEPSIEQIDSVIESEGDMVEIHTGNYANQYNSNNYHNELARIIKAVDYAKSKGLKVAAGHGLNYFNIKPIAKLKNIDEFSIGHSIIARAVFTGIDKAVRDMLALINTTEN